jgi:alkylated DNA repair dioxygenase AlkB
VPDADVRWLQRLELPEPDDAVLARLIEETPWHQETITVWRRTYLQPRLTAWYGDAGARYRYSGLDLEPLPWTDLLSALRAAVEGAVGASFNSVLLNYYRDRSDSMGLHSDDEPELGPEPVIASLSLGATRTFMLKHRRRRDLDPVRLPLASGTLLVMQGSTQRNWKHGIAKQARPCGARVNLTFRRILPRRGE